MANTKELTDITREKLDGFRGKMKKFGVDVQPLKPLIKEAVDEAVRAIDEGDPVCASAISFSSSTMWLTAPPPRSRNMCIASHVPFVAAQSEKSKKGKGKKEATEQKKEKRERAPTFGAFNYIYNVSDALREIVGHEPLTKGQVTKKIWDYIKVRPRVVLSLHVHSLSRLPPRPPLRLSCIVCPLSGPPQEKNLQDDYDKRRITSDATLARVLGTPNFNMFELSKLVAPHLLGEFAPPTPSPSWPPPLCPSS